MNTHHMSSSHTTVETLISGIGKEEFRLVHTILLIRNPRDRANPDLYMAKNRNGPTGAVAKENGRGGSGCPVRMPSITTSTTLPSRLHYRNIRTTII
ncbi:hypothetical protein [Paracoccus beibuensis]|uniref:hypothetical protein n=1 Tax=Paracoccus beibuensis TaxID=547602 RepID=UPI00223FF4DA|nr:hypothetical protein [Paracoccus beibuensis]